MTFSRNIQHTRVCVLQFSCLPFLPTIWRFWQ